MALKITAALRTELTRLGLAADADEKAAASFVAEKLADQSLSPETLKSLSAEPTGTTEAKLASIVKDAVVTGVAEAIKPLAGLGDALNKLADKIGGNGDAEAAAKAKADAEAKAKADADEAAKKEAEKKKLGNGEDDLEARLKRLETMATGSSMRTSRVSPAKVFGATAPDDDPDHEIVARVKGVAERFEKSRKGLVFPEFHAKTGRPINHGRVGTRVAYADRPLDELSQLDKAVNAAYFKLRLAHAADRKGHNVPNLLRVTEQDRDLFRYAVEECEWSGYIAGADQEVKEAKLTRDQKASLLDDATSGGIEITPTVFDDAIVMIPLLYGEIVPLVNLKMVPRGRRIEGASMLNPTITSATSEATAITAFDATGFILEKNCDIMVAQGAMDIGKDFLDDSPTAIANQVSEAYGWSFQAWLDNQIINGDGTTEPLGVLVASGTTAVTFAFGNTGPITVGDIELLMFGVSKAYRNALGGRTAFFSRDTTYRRVSGIRVGSDDVRRVFGMEKNYMVFDQPWKIQEDIAETSAGFGNFAFYNLYRERGWDMEVVDSGRTNALANQITVVGRARYGGRPMQGAAFAVATNAANQDS